MTGHTNGRVKSGTSLVSRADYGPAYTGLANAMFYGGSAGRNVAVMNAALATADKGVALAPQFAEGYQARGYI